MDNGMEKGKAQRALVILPVPFFILIIIRGRTLCRNIKNPVRSRSVILTVCIWAIRR